jgi:hypothetical protein
MQQQAAAATATATTTTTCKNNMQEQHARTCKKCKTCKQKYGILQAMQHIKQMQTT